MGTDTLCIKYTHPAAARYYRDPGGRLPISSSPAFTWGPATYVTPLAYPNSSAIFGRVGIVSRFDPSDWNVIDMTTSLGQEAYLMWLSHQPQAKKASLTMHGSVINGKLKAAFRHEFKIDCILFPPDQLNNEYTHKDDTWMAVTDWGRARELRRDGFSNRFHDPKITVIAEDEFKDHRHGGERRQLLRLSGTSMKMPTTPEVADAYALGNLVRIPA